jgi:hypothetical protein
MAPGSVALSLRGRPCLLERTELGDAIAEQGRVVSESAAHYGVDWSIVHAAFVEHVKAPLAAPLPQVLVMGMDETRRGKHRHRRLCQISRKTLVP